MRPEPKYCPTCGAELAQIPTAVCPRCGGDLSLGERDPHFHDFCRSFNRRALILCGVALPVGVFMKQPVVWGLALLGIVVTVYRLNRWGFRRSSP